MKNSFNDKTEPKASTKTILKMMSNATKASIFCRYL